MTSTILLILCVSVCSVYCDKPSYAVAEGCDDKVMDIYFVMDSSSSLHHVEYQKVLEFVRNVISRLDIGDDKTRVGALTFSLRVNMQPHPLSLTNFTNKLDIMNYIKEENFPFISSITSTDEAIKYVRENPEFRQLVTKVIVVVTDGGSRDPESTLREAELARDQGFYLFVIGVGQYHDESEWQAIATDPDAKFIFNITNFQQLRANQGSLARRACSLLPLKTCSGNGAYATLYYISGSVETFNLTYQISDNFVDSVTGDRSNILSGYFLHNCLEHDLPFDKIGSINCSRNAPPRQYSMSDLLYQAELGVTASVNNRGDHNQVMVIVVDDTSLEHVSKGKIDLLVGEKNIGIILVDKSREGVNDLVRGALGIPSNYVRIIPGITEMEQSIRSLNKITCEALTREQLSSGPEPSK